MNPISMTLQNEGFTPSAVVSRVAVRVDNIRPLEGWHARGDPVRAEAILDRFGLGFGRVLLVDKGDHYQTIDGEHRVRASQMAGAKTIDAYVLSDDAFEVLFPKYGEEQLSDWVEGL